LKSAFDPAIAQFDDALPGIKNRCDVAQSSVTDLAQFLIVQTEGDPALSPEACALWSAQPAATRRSIRWWL
jgi:hypothetical protein